MLYIHENMNRLCYYIHSNTNHHQQKVTYIWSACNTSSNSCINASKASSILIVMHIAYYTLEHDAHSNKSTTVVYMAIIPLEVPKSCGKGWDAHLGLSAEREHACPWISQLIREQDRL